MNIKFREQRCLDEVLEFSRTCRGDKYKLLRTLMRKIESSERIPLAANERPDFLFKSAEGKGIGIEHFYVSHYSEIAPNGKVSTPDRALWVEISNRYARWRDAVLSASAENDLSKADWVIRDMAVALEKDFTYSTKVGYFKYLRSFKHSLGRHLGKVSAYRSVMEREGVAQGLLIFLIELNSYACSYWILDNRGEHKTVSMPMFSTVVPLLERALNSGVDYIILHNRGTLCRPEVIILRKGDLKSQLLKQGYKIYEYITVENCFDNVSEVRVDAKRQSGDESILLSRMTMDNLTWEGVVQPMVRLIPMVWRARNEGKNVALSSGGYILLQLCVDIFRSGSKWAKEVLSQVAAQIDELSNTNKLL